MPEDRIVTATYRMPLVGRSSRRTPVRGATEEVSEAVVLRAVPARSMQPFRVEAPTFRRTYFAHAGRTWQALAFPKASSITNWDRRAPLGDVVEALASGRRIGLALALMGRSPSPLSPHFGGIHPLALAESHPDGAQGLRDDVAERLRGMFGEEVVHDGEHVYVAVPGPMLRLRRNRNGSWSVGATPAEVFDPANADLSACARQWRRFAKAVATVDASAARSVRREAKPIVSAFGEGPGDDLDVSGFANAASVGALWLRKRLRHAKPEPGAQAEEFATLLGSVSRRAALGAYGALPPEERMQAVLDARDLVAGLARMTPRSEPVPEMNAFLETVRHVMLPRLAETRRALPDEDLSDIAGLAP